MWGLDFVLLTKNLKYFFIMSCARIYMLVNYIMTIGHHFSINEKMLKQVYKRQNFPSNL